jgi:hypothetical protein
MTQFELEAEIRNLNDRVEDIAQNLPMAGSIQATRHEVHTLSVQLAGVKEDLTRVAGQVARLHTLMARLVPSDGKKRHL